MLATPLGYVRGIGLEADWVVIEAIADSSL